MNEAEKKAVLISQLPRILKKENVVVIAGSDEMMEACVQIGNAKALIPMMQNALLIAIDSLPDPVLRLKVRQQVSTQIMTKDMTELVQKLCECGMGSVTKLEEEDDDDAM